MMHLQHPHNVNTNTVDGEQPKEPREETHQVKKAVPAWIISTASHLVILGMLSLIVIATKEEYEEPAVKSAVLPIHSAPIIPPSITKVVTTAVHIDVGTESATPNPVQPYEEPSDASISDVDETQNTSVGDVDAISDKQMGSDGPFITIGVGSHAANAFGPRTGGGRNRAVKLFGGTPGSEEAVDRALRWFKKHQSPNGMWDMDGYPANCSEAPKCEPGTEHTGDDGDNAATAYAILCFLGAGYDHRMTSKYKLTVKRGLEWLVSIQKPDGSFGRNYEQGIATMALAEAYAMSNDPALKGPAQKGIDVICARQTPSAAGGYGLGWDYVHPNPARIDSSVSGWCVMALKSAAAGGLNVGNGMEGAKNWVEGAWKAANPTFKAKDPYTDVSGFPYTWNTETGAAEGGPGRACIGALCAVFLGHKGDDTMLNSLANYIMKHDVPVAYPTNTYYLYYNTLAIFQVAGDRWTTWNSTMRDLLIKSQRTEGCFNGSWDPQGTGVSASMRIINTAYCCLSLEVYYRYKQVNDIKH